MAKALRSFRRCLASEPSEPLAEDTSCRLESSRLPPGSGATEAPRGLPMASVLKRRCRRYQTLDESETSSCWNGLQAVPMLLRSSNDFRRSARGWYTIRAEQFISSDKVMVY